MNITIGKFSFDVLLLIRLWLPAIVFIGLCTGIFIAFDPLLLLLDQIAPGLIPVAWLSLFVLYIVLGVTFTFIAARMVRRSFKSKELLVQRRMAYLSGLPLYACGLLLLGASIRANFIPDLPAAAAFASIVLFLLFCMASGGYLLMVRFLFLRRPAAPVHSA
jgi:hypothetical protein